MIQRAQQNPTPEVPRLTEDELWYLGFLQFAEETIAEGLLPCHSRPAGLIWRLQNSLADQGLVRYVGPRTPIPSVELTEEGRAIDPRSEPNDHPPGLFPDEVPEMEVCHDCGQVVGRFFFAPHDFRVQHGRCPAHAAPEAETARWPGYDYNLHADLCRCCGRAPLASGSRWSVWFCQACKEQVELLNARHGRCIVPIGRHSVHAGHVLSEDQARDPAAIDAFLATMNALGQVHDVLRRWAEGVVRRNLDAIGVAAGEAVLLERYWSAVRGRVDPDDRFREMCGFLEEAGRDADGRAGR